MKPNAMKAKILSGQPAFGIGMAMPSPQLVEMLGRLGFEWVLIDCEHGTIALESVELMCMAAEISGMTPIVRPPANRPDAILQVMDRGAMGVQVPHVNTAADARRAVEAVKYHPLGSRGLAASTRAADYGTGRSVADYVDMANRETLVCVQIEEVEALHHLDEILQVKGVDVFFVGPADLSQSLGYPGQLNALPVREAIDRALAQIVAAGKAPGSTGNTQAIVEYVSKGCLYLYAQVPRLLASASAEFFSTIRSMQKA